jgi:histidinol dehydrogenase
VITVSISKKINSYIEVSLKAKRLKKEILDEIKHKANEEVVDKIKKFEKLCKLSNIKLSDDEIVLEYYDCYEEMPKFVKINRNDVRL